MSSDRQVEANRKNAKRSTGPRSNGGKRRSRNNAFRHGLAVAMASAPSFNAEVEVLAKAIFRTKDQTNHEFARQAAEAEMDLLRIRKIRASLFAPVCGTQEPRSDDYSALNESLAKLKRYERRAFARRKRALRAMALAN